MENNNANFKQTLIENPILVARMLATKAAQNKAVRNVAINQAKKTYTRLNNTNNSSYSNRRVTVNNNHTSSNNGNVGNNNEDREDNNNTNSSSSNNNNNKTSLLDTIKNHKSDIKKPLDTTKATAQTLLRNTINNLS